LTDYLPRRGGDGGTYERKVEKGGREREGMREKGGRDRETGEVRKAKKPTRLIVRLSACFDLFLNTLGHRDMHAKQVCTPGEVASLATRIR